jgi:hypothetical protein
MQLMPNSISNFRTNVRHVLDVTEGLGVNALTARMNEARRKENRRRERRGDRLLPMVSRPSVSHLLLGTYNDCSMAFAEEVAAALDIPLATLLESSERFSEIWAQPA